jgi:protein-S-isoprenylcysteine O-methyltransferase Ste14
MTRLPSLGPRGEGWVALQLALLASTGLAGLVGPSWDLGIRPLEVAAGAVLLAVGLTLAVLGIRDLRQALTPLPYPRDDSELVRTGVYGRVRHPIYGGLVVGSLGWALATASFMALAMAVVLFGFFELKSRREEAWLETRYPEYPDYRARTGRFIPWPGATRD